MHTRLPAWRLPWQVRIERTGPALLASARLARNVRETIVFATFAYICWWSIYDVSRKPGRWMSEPTRCLGYLFRIDQHWAMFAPTVFKGDGWFILEGTTKSGQVLDLNREGLPVPYTKPQAAVKLFKNDRWRKYSENYLFIDNSWMRPYYCNYWLRIWHQNPTHPPLAHLTVIYTKEISLPDS